MHRIELPFVAKETSDLLLWRDVKKTGVCFGGSTALYIVLGCLGLSIPVLLARLLLVVVSGAALWAFAAPFLKRHGPAAFVPKILTTGLQQADAHKLADLAVEPINQVLGLAGKLASGTDRALSIKAAGGLYLASVVLNCVSILTLAYSVVFLAFVLPKAYELKKDDVDKLLDQALTKAKELYAKADELVFKKIPTGHKKVA